MKEQTIYLSSEFVIHACTKCGTAYAILREFENYRRDDHASFYCPNGHGQHYPQKTDEEKLQDQLKHCRADRDFWEEGYNDATKKQKVLKRSRAALKGVVTKMKKGTL